MTESESKASRSLLDRFVRLCEVPSPVYNERRIADVVSAELRRLGLEVTEDDVAAKIGAGAGNLLTRIPGQGDGWLMLCAHIDTVPHEGSVEVELADGVYRSKGNTILGADNKASVAVLLELAARWAESPPPLGIELLFTVAEEDGLRGAKEFDVSKLRAPFGYVFDHPTPIGEVIMATPTYKRLLAEFDGKESHAGVAPELGHSAIAAAAAAIAEMKLGRLDEETTANVGVISGGTATNVVAGHCRIDGEARSLDDAKAAETIGAMVEACSFAATEHGCDVDVSVEEMFRGYRQERNLPAVDVAFAALASRGHEPYEAVTGGGSDANAFVAAGFECVNLGNGTLAPHTPEESVPASAIVEMLGVAEAIAEEAAKRC
jgi:tripeptide aminopeptidase